jgi:hypothetical protein
MFESQVFLYRPEPHLGKAFMDPLFFSFPVLDL